MSPVAAAAPAFICRERPLPASTTLAPAPAASSAVLPMPTTSAQFCHSALLRGMTIELPIKS